MFVSPSYASNHPIGLPPLSCFWSFKLNTKESFIQNIKNIELNYKPIPHFYPPSCIRWKEWCRAMIGGQSWVTCWLGSAGRWSTIQQKTRTTNWVRTWESNNKYTNTIIINIILVLKEDLPKIWYFVDYWKIKKILCEIIRSLLQCHILSKQRTIHCWMMKKRCVFMFELDLKF